MRWEPVLYLVLLFVISMAVFGWAVVRRRTWISLAAGYTGGITGVFWISSLQAGPAEVRDLWPYFSLGLIPCLAAIAFWQCFRLPSLWQRVPIVVTSSLVGLPAAFLLFIMLSMQGSCTRRHPPLYSPDGWHAAVMRNAMQGAVGPDGALIYVRRTWSPVSGMAYVGYADTSSKGPQGLTPQVRWLDSSRLLIQLIDHPRHRKHTCAQQVGEITILCEAVSTQ
jgi:hypothetical protein